jgi:glycosyltransferase involved in cell wall biosynthesis
MPSTSLKLLMGIYFYPRGGSAHVCRALARELGHSDIDVTVLSGSRSDLGSPARAESFYAGLDLRAVDFTPALGSPEPLRFEGGAGTAPPHGSYEDRPQAEDPVLAALDDAAFELQVEAWARELGLAGAAAADVLYLHHLTPLNEAAARAFPGIPVLGHVHGTELLMLERIAAGAPASWPHAEAWRERICRWAGDCERIVVSSAEGLRRAAAVLDLEPSRFACIPNGFDPSFAPREVDRHTHWRRHLVEQPHGWAPGSPPGSVAYEEADMAKLEGAVLLYTGRFTEVKRLPLLIEAFGRARARFRDRAALVLLGGYPGEWEGEHPLATVERLGLEDVFLAGWHSHEELPDFFNAADLLLHAAAREQFGQVLVEAMACELPVVAVDGHGPAAIVENGETGWLVPPEDPQALADAVVEAVNDAPERRRRGRRAREEVVDRYAWRGIGADLARLVEELAAPARH